MTKPDAVKPTIEIKIDQKIEPKSLFGAVPSSTGGVSLFGAPATKKEESLFGAAKPEVKDSLFNKDKPKDSLFAPAKVEEPKPT